MNLLQPVPDDEPVRLAFPVDNIQVGTGAAQLSDGMWVRACAIELFPVGDHPAMTFLIPTEFLDQLAMSVLEASMELSPGLPPAGL